MAHVVLFGRQSDVETTKMHPAVVRCVPARGLSADGATTRRGIRTDRILQGDRGFREF